MLKEERCQFFGGPKDGCLEDRPPMPEMRFPIMGSGTRVGNDLTDIYIVNHRYIFKTRTEDMVYQYTYTGVE